ncbi:MAG TPA: 2-phospho-L-lactate guanylyltransferase [Xanthobacteraceae bacterium]|jgi:2-phospho-L-lactate guanylyltransferase
MKAKGIWAVIPVKETAAAKQRLAASVPEHVREKLVLTMLEDVLAAVAAARGLAGLALVTVDPQAIAIAQRYGARILTDGARSGHTGAVAAAARVLACEGVDGMMQVPGDIPAATGDEITQVLARHRGAPAFTIVPSHDECGSNTVVVSPPDAVPLTFGENSYFPHLRTARECGIDPQIIRLPGIGRDIDNAEDLAAFAAMRSPTRTQALLDRNGFPEWRCALSAKRRSGGR